jgi:hypothetical protein
MLKLWVKLMSLDVVELDPSRRQLVLRYSADSAAGAFAGDAKLPVSEARTMAMLLFDLLADETRRRCGQGSRSPVTDNQRDVELRLTPFLASFQFTLDADEPEPMELALARTAGIDFLSQTVSLWEQELPDRVDILLGRAASNLQYGYPDESARDLAKVDLLDPGNARAAALRKRLGQSSTETPAAASRVARRRSAPASSRASRPPRRRSE